MNGGGEDMKTVTKYLKSCLTKEQIDLFCIIQEARTQTNGLQLQGSMFRTDIRRNSCINSFQSLGQLP